MNSQHSQQKYKQNSSQQDTRNPTTNKKVIFYTPVQKKSNKNYHSMNNRTSDKNNLFVNKTLRNKSNTIHNSMYELSAKKQQCIRSSRYQEAKQINKVLIDLQKRRAKTQLKKLSLEHQKQKKLVKKAHKKQMRKFQTAWQNYFIGLRAQQQRAMIEFKRSQQTQIKYIQNQLVQKCRSIKINKGPIKSLQKKQKSLKKQQRYEDLIVLKKQKKRLKQRLLKDQQQKIYNWAKQYQDFLKSYHTKKYNTLISRIQEIHNDKYRRYQRQNNRLKLKYHNVLKKLGHQQKMQVNYTLEKYPYAKQIKNQRSFTMNL